MAQAVISKEVAADAIRCRLAALQQRSRAELAALPEWSNDEVLLDGHPVTVTTYREQSADAQFRVIVQVTTHPTPFLKVFSACQAFAEGIAIGADGTIRELGQDELYDYL